nr:exonuclease domain-containing protein [Bacteriovorax sp. HI3]
MKLTTLPLFFLDLQTTGSKPGDAHILEMAYATMDSSIESFFVEQPQGHEVPRRIQMITGVSTADMETAIAFPEAMKKLSSFVKSVSPDKKAICIIHFAQFEKPFLLSAFEAIKEELPFVILCTHEIAKRLLPNLPTRGIKGLAGYFGYDAGELKRGHSHVEATRLIWSKLLDLLAEKEISTFLDLENWLAITPKAIRTKYEYPLPKEKRLTLPDVPGIYRMLNYKGEVLYVGKATSLKSRVNSYFRGQKKRDPKKLEMLTQVLDLRVTECATPLEAALMETDEIKRLNPRYNIALKKGQRSLVFFDRDFISLSSTPDEIHTIGPFSHAMVFEAMMKFIEYLKEKDQKLPDENTFFDTIEPELIKEGFELFCETHGFSPETFTSMRSVIAQGILWHRQEEPEEEIADFDEEAQEEIDETLEEAEVLLTPLDVAAKFERHFTRIGKSYLRARKINRMLNADIDFSPVNYPARLLKIRNGYLESNEHSRIHHSWADHSIETYDRMTVLLSELDRVRSQDGTYHITFVE